MKKVAITGVRQAEIVEVPDPRPVADWALVKVTVAPMCTEYKAFQAGRPNANLGHEAAGIVQEVAQPGKVKVGDRVVVMPLYSCGKCELCLVGDYIHCEHAPDFAAFTGGQEGRATYAQYLLKPDWLLLPIPDDLSTEMGSLACCGLGPTFGACQRMAVDAFDTVLITGLGPVGLGGVINARYRGARVIAVESVHYRVEKAEELGAEIVLDPRDGGTLARIRELTGGRGVDKAIDCSGVVQAQRLCIDAARRRGQVAFVGECSDDLAIKISPDMIRKGLTLHGSWHYNLADYPRLLQVIRRSPLVQQLISHVLPMSQAQQALELVSSHQCAKVLLKPWE